MVGAPAEPLPLDVFGLLFARRNISGSIIGGIRETQEMLDFCGEHNVTADIEMIGISRSTEAYDRLLKERPEMPLRHRYGIAEVRTAFSAKRKTASQCEAVCL